MALPPGCDRDPDSLQPLHLLEFPLDPRSNVPTVHDIPYTAEQREVIGQWLRPSQSMHIMNLEANWCVAVDHVVHFSRG